MYDYGPQLNKRVGWYRGLQFLPDVASHALVPAVLPVSARPLRLDGELPGCEIGPPWYSMDGNWWWWNFGGISLVLYW